MWKHLKLRLRHARARRRVQRQTARREVAVFGAIYVVYNAARWAWAGHLSVARAHARQVLTVERFLHIAAEGPVRRALGVGVPGLVLSNIYLVAQGIVLPAVLVWLYRHSPRIYRQLRGTVVVTWLIATPMFALYPVAPPRLAGIGAKDVVSQHAVVKLTGASTLFYNPYAAVPSLHVGLAFAIGIALAAALRRRWTRALALLWGPLVTLAVIATGNHYFFDAATGLIVVCAAFATTRAMDRGRLKLRFSSRAAAIRESGAPVPAAEPLALAAAATVGPATGSNASRPLAAPVAARPTRLTIAAAVTD